MTLEYLLLLVVSVAILLGAFGMKTGPARMFSTSSPVLAHHVEKKMVTGWGFITEMGDRPLGWTRSSQ